MSNYTGYVVYWAFNDYPVTVFDLVANLVVVIIGLWILGLNYIVLKVLYDKENKEPSDYFIINLSTADFLTGIYLLYNTAYNMTNYRHLTECLLRVGFGNGVIICSVFQLVVLSMDRYIHIIYPYRYSTLCNKVSIIIAGIITWTLSFVIAMLPALGWMNPQPFTNFCGYMKILTKDYFRLLLAVFLTPAFLMILMYLRIFKEAHHHAKAIRNSQPCAGDGTNTMAHSLKFAKTVFSVVGTYMICWAPMGTVVALHVNGDLDGYTYIEKGNLMVYTSAPAYINSLLNPVIYSIKIPLIRDRFKRIFCRAKVSRMT